MSNYSEELKDPRWQKKRLEIMNRDNFSCQVCNCGLNDKKTLNVHHLCYIPNFKPWEYPDNILITLCEECHQKVHDGGIKIVTIKETKLIQTEEERTVEEKVTDNGKKKKKEPLMTIYKYFFNSGELLPNEAVVYSQLINDAAFKIGWNNTTKSYNSEIVRSFVIKNASEGYGEVLPLVPYHISELSRRTSLTRVSIRKMINSLKERGLITDKFVKCPLEVLKPGYIRIPSSLKLKGRQLLFYALIKDIATRHEGAIDTWARELAKRSGITKSNAYSILSIFSKEGLVKRLKSGKLKVM